jgi:hypothetical protein
MVGERFNRRQRSPRTKTAGNRKFSHNAQMIVGDPCPREFLPVPPVAPAKRLQLTAIRRNEQKVLAYPIVDNTVTLCRDLERLPMSTA